MVQRIFLPVAATTLVFLCGCDRDAPATRDAGNAGGTAGETSAPAYRPPTHSAEVEALRLLGSADNALVKVESNSIEETYARSGAIRTILNRTVIGKNLAENLYTAADEVRAKVQNFAGSEATFFVSVSPSIDEIKKLLGAPEEVLPPVDEPQIGTLTWNRYGWLSFGANDQGMVRCLRVAFLPV